MYAPIYYYYSQDASTSLTVNVTIEESKEGGGREEIRLSGRALSFE
jgi:hypothetical protein